MKVRRVAASKGRFAKDVKIHKVSSIMPHGDALVAYTACGLVLDCWAEVVIKVATCLACREGRRAR